LLLATSRVTVLESPARRRLPNDLESGFHLSRLEQRMS
jgi:hypothetical protein